MFDSFPDQQWLSGDIQPNLVTGHTHSVIQYHTSIGARVMYFIMVILSISKQTNKKKKAQVFGTDKHSKTELQGVVLGKIQAK